MLFLYLQAAEQSRRPGFSLPFCRTPLHVLDKPLHLAYILSRHRILFALGGMLMTKALISVTGLDTTGIIARVATKLADMNINILDITQTILDGYFTMMMVVDLDGAHLGFADIDKELQTVRDELKMSIHMQRMDIFDAMHRI